jgi:hypothetical protein
MTDAKLIAALRDSATHQLAFAPNLIPDALMSKAASRIESLSLELETQRDITDREMDRAERLMFLAFMLTWRDDLDEQRGKG